MHKPDAILLWIFGIIIIAGLIILSSASIVMSQQNYGNSYYYVLHQILIGLFGGIVLFAIALAVPLNFWKKAAFPILLASVALLILVFIPGFGHNAYGASRWLSLGDVPVQPSEIAKVAFLIYLAALFSNRKKEGEVIKFITFLVAVGALAILIVLQPDMGTLGVIAISSLVVYFGSGAKIGYVILAILIGLVSVYVLIKMEPYRSNRLTAFLHPDKYTQSISYQVNQSFIAIGSGGVFGRGFGNSVEKYDYLPEPINDSIFAVLVEELGMIGGLVLLALFILFFWRGLDIALNVDNDFYKLLALGISSVIIIQVFINISSSLGLIPYTGVNLPFVSYGGSSYTVMMFAVGLLTHISKYANI